MVKKGTDCDPTMWNSNLTTHNIPLIDLHYGPCAGASWHSLGGKMYKNLYIFLSSGYTLSM